MANIGNKVKDILSRSAKFVGMSIRGLVRAVKFKTSELSALGKRRDLISDLGAKVYELRENGLVLPEEASELVRQISALDNELTILRAERTAQKAADAQQRAAEKAARAAEKAAEKAAAAMKMSTSPVESNDPEPVAPVAETEFPEYIQNPVVPTLEVASSDDAADPESAGEDVPTLNV